MRKIFLTKLKNNKKNHIKMNIKKVVKTLMFIIISLLLFTLGKAITKDIIVNVEINRFKERAIFEYEENFEYYPGEMQHRKYYKVPRETSYEKNDKRNVFYDENKKYLGQTGDVFLSQESPFPNVFGIHQFISYYFGGHAAIKTNYNTFVEAVGFPSSDESLLDIITHPGDQPHDYSVTINETSSNYWLNPKYRSKESEDYPYYGSYYRSKFIGVRVKNIDEESIDKALDYALDKVDKNLYNFLFFLDMKYKFYCTDLISRAYQDVMVEKDKQSVYARSLNDDGFITSVNDIIISKDTYIAFYVEIINDIVHIYYLEDVEE